MKKEKFKLSKFSIFSIGVMIGAIVMGLFVVMTISSIQEKQEIRDYIIGSEQEIINNCSNLSIVEASECLVNNSNPFYLYNVTDDKEELSLEDLKQKGGDCKDWSELYARLGRELGFYTTTPEIRTSNNTNHQIAVLSNKDAYCFIDSSRIQSFSRCMGFGE